MLLETDCTSRHQENSIVKYVDDTIIIGHIKDNVVHIVRKLKILQSGTKRTIYCSTSATKTTVYIWEDDLEEVNRVWCLGSDLINPCRCVYIEILGSHEQNILNPPKL